MTDDTNSYVAHKLKQARNYATHDSKFAIITRNLLSQMQSLIKLRKSRTYFDQWIGNGMYSKMYRKLYYFQFVCVCFCLCTLVCSQHIEQRRIQNSNTNYILLFQFLRIPDNDRPKTESLYLIIWPQISLQPGKHQCVIINWKHNPNFQLKLTIHISTSTPTHINKQTMSQTI